MSMHAHHRAHVKVREHLAEVVHLDCVGSQD